MNYFEMFGLDATFAVDLARLEHAFHELQKRVHPDRFAVASLSERQAAEVWASRVNEAYRTLKSPLPRTAYLLELLAGKQVHTALSEEFLQEQLIRREVLEDIQQSGNIDQLAVLSAKYLSETEQDWGRIAQQFSAQNYIQVATLLAKIQFTEKLLLEIAATLAEKEKFSP